MAAGRALSTARASWRAGLAALPVRAGARPDAACHRPAGVSATPPPRARGYDRRRHTGTAGLGERGRDGLHGAGTHTGLAGGRDPWPICLDPAWSAQDIRSLRGLDLAGTS